MTEISVHVTLNTNKLTQDTLGIRRKYPRLKPPASSWGLFNASQVMSVTVHKSVQSLSMYQHVDDDEKIMMGNARTENIAPKSTLALPSSSTPMAIMPPPVDRSEHSATNPLQKLVPAGIENRLLCDFDDVNVPSYTTQHISNRLSQMRMMSFQNCSVTINMNMDK